MTDIKIKLFHHRDTKNTVVYHAWPVGGQQALKGGDSIETLYIQKVAFNGNGFPKEITVTVTA